MCLGSASWSKVKESHAVMALVLQGPETACEGHHGVRGRQHGATPTD